MARCKLCGGNLESIGGGKYMCDCCGGTFSESDLAPRPAAKPKTVQNATPMSAEDSGETVYEKVMNGVLEIRCAFPGFTSSGSGYLFSDRGFAITNTHVITNAEDGFKTSNSIKVKIAGEEVSASIVAIGDNRGGHGDGIDLAILSLSRVPAAAKTVSFANFSSVKN